MTVNQGVCAAVVRRRVAATVIKTKVRQKDHRVEGQAAAAQSDSKEAHSKVGSGTAI